MMTQPKYVALLALGVCSTAACAKHEPERPMTPAAYPPPPPPSPATTQRPVNQPPQPSPMSEAAPMTMTDTERSARAITAARCEREVRCDNVGQEKEYMTEEDCLASLEPGTRKELGTDEQCPGGFPAIKLNECIEEIRAESCDTPLDDIARVAECRMNALCPE